MATRFSVRAGACASPSRHPKFIPQDSTVPAGGPFPTGAWLAESKVRAHGWSWGESSTGHTPSVSDESLRGQLGPRIVEKETSCSL